MQNSMLDKLNKVYFARLKEILTEKLGTCSQYSLNFSDIDIKSVISSNISIYSIMADYILESTERKPDINKYKALLVEKIKKDAKFIIGYVNEQVENFINEKGDKKVLEFKNWLLGETYKTLNQIEKQSYQKETEQEA